MLQLVRQYPGIDEHFKGVYPGAQSIYQERGRQAQVVGQSLPVRETGVVDLKPRGLPIPDWTLKMLFDGHHHSVVFPSLLSPWPDTDFHCRRVIVHL